MGPEVEAWYRHCFFGSETTIRPCVQDCELVFPMMDFAYARRGAYVDGVRRWVREFGRKNVLIVTQQDLCARPEATMARVFRHLGLAPLPELTPVQANASVGEKPVVTPVAMAMLQRAMADSNAQLAEEFGVHF